VITVQGYIEGVSYAVQIDPERQLSDADGVLVDPPASVSLLMALHETEEIAMTPTGPTVVGDRSDALGALAILQAHSDVTSIDGELPEGYPENEPGVVY